MIFALVASVNTSKTVCIIASTEAQLIKGRVTEF